MPSHSLRNAGISTESTASLTAEVTTESKVLCCSLNANLILLAIATSISSLEMVESLNLFFIGDCPISLFRSPLTVEALMMSPMQSGSKFTDKITKYLTKSAERKTTRASKSKSHVISNIVIVIYIVIILGVKAPLDLFYAINICFIYTTFVCFIYKVLSSTNIYFYIYTDT